MSRGTEQLLQRVETVLQCSTDPQIVIQSGVRHQPAETRKILAEDGTISQHKTVHISCQKDGHPCDFRLRNLSATTSTRCTGYISEAASTKYWIKPNSDIQPAAH